MAAVRSSFSPTPARRASRSAAQPLPQAPATPTVRTPGPARRSRPQERRMSRPAPMPAARPHGRASTIARPPSHRVARRPASKSSSPAPPSAHQTGRCRQCCRSTRCHTVGSVRQAAVNDMVLPRGHSPTGLGGKPSRITKAFRPPVRSLAGASGTVNATPAFSAGVAVRGLRAVWEGGRVSPRPPVSTSERTEGVME